MKESKGKKRAREDSTANSSDEDDETLKDNFMVKKRRSKRAPRAQIRQKKKQVPDKGTKKKPADSTIPSQLKIPTKKGEKQIFSKNIHSSKVHSGSQKKHAKETSRKSKFVTNVSDSQQIDVPENNALLLTSLGKLPKGLVKLSPKKQGKLAGEKATESGNPVVSSVPELMDLKVSDSFNIPTPDTINTHRRGHHRQLFSSKCSG